MSEPVLAANDQQREIDDLKARLAEAEETLQAIRQGEVDAVVVRGAAGPQVYTLHNADHPYRVIIERMQEGALTLTPDGTILFANQRLASFLDLPLPNIAGQKFGDFIAESDRPLFDALLAQDDRDGRRSELSLRSADGLAVPVYLFLADLPDEGQKIVSAIVTDLRWPKQRMRELTEANAMLVKTMAERERAETMLRQALKMEAVGQLTAGIAHDFNNLLMVIGGNMELFLARTSDQWLRRRIEASQRAVDRGARLIGQLLSFSRHQTLQPHAVAVNALLLDFEPLLSSAVGDGIRLKLVLSDRASVCQIDPTELQASILNLVTNAKDAMPQGGLVTIATEDTDVDGQPDSGVGPIIAGRYLSIVVTDTGCGMPPNVRERAFDPFFTTKDVGKGTGLGLSQVYGFMRQSGGHVTIDSAIGTGTSVRLYLPRTTVAADPAVRPAAAYIPRTEPRAQRALVVEDDRDVRELVIEALESFGYVAIAVENGPMALNLLDSGTVVDVVVSDIQMPDGMSGFELARSIRNRLPHQAIVLTSGMTRFAQVPDDAVPDLPILRKPYQCEDLAQAIDAALLAVA